MKDVQNILHYCDKLKDGIENVHIIFYDNDKVKDVHFSAS